jgi:porphobilinogen synthase
MMDGQVGHVRAALDAEGFTDTLLLAYAAKYTSGLYGPFREAVQSSLQGDRAAYQQDPANSDEAIREIELDLAEGADIIMVKPAQPHLDIIAAAAAISTVPVAAYQISGEYAQIVAAAERGWIERERVVLESLLHLKRAGAKIILSYFALEIAEKSLKISRP